jgi:glucosamine 6-phosphate synthetase-like amidotransferase/phosphosugar isomerase protein
MKYILNTIFIFACLQTFSQRTIKASELVVDNSEDAYVLKSDFTIIIDSTTISTSMGALKIISKEDSTYVAIFDNNTYRVTLTEWQLIIENIETKGTQTYYLNKQLMQEKTPNR